MIRFIDLKEQITEKEFEFAWYSTVIDKFLEFGGNQTWYSWNEFKKDFEPIKEISEIERFKNLFPKNKLQKG